MKIDLHVHLENRPYRYARKLVQQAKEALMDALCLTEHNAESPPDYYDALKSDVDIPVFWASEYSSQQGHILVFTPDEKITYEKPYLHIQEIIDIASKAGGIAIPVHPYTKIHSTPLADGIFLLKNLVAVETINGALSSDSNILAEAARSRMGIKGTGGSDAHNEFMVGRAYTIFKDNIKTTKDLIKALLNGRYSAAKNNFTNFQDER